MIVVHKFFQKLPSTRTAKQSIKNVLCSFFLKMLSHWLGKHNWEKYIGCLEVVSGLKVYSQTSLQHNIAEYPQSKPKTKFSNKPNFNGPVWISLPTYPYIYNMLHGIFTKYSFFLFGELKVKIKKELKPKKLTPGFWKRPKRNGKGMLNSSGQKRRQSVVKNTRSDCLIETPSFLRPQNQH